MRRRFWRGLLMVGAVAAVAALAAVIWAGVRLRASLPVVEGQMRMSGLQHPVTITRDALGIPTIRGASRADVARATGFVHAQDRFFQMDLARRRAAGEISALVGARALTLDKDIRIHRFRSQAQRALRLLPSRDRELLEAYTLGVNAGLTSLGAAPFEYTVLRQTPRAWLPEDCLLVVLSMFITLQDPEGLYEATLATLHDVLPPAMAAFLAPAGTEWDSPVAGGTFETPPIPGADVYDLRARRNGRSGVVLPPPRRPEVVRNPGPRSHEDAWAAALGTGRQSEATGSNSFAVAGRLAGGGPALVANDMHLTVRVPNTWYRAALAWTDTSGTHTLTGITLPGVPALVTGSNTHIAWGFTNTYADWGDIILLEVDPADRTRYRTPHGWRSFQQYEETFDIAGEASARSEVTWTIWGPVMAPDHAGRPRAYSWVAHSAERLASTVTPLESARSVKEAFAAANGIGTPGQNLVVGDTSGNIGWSIYGSIPRRVGTDGRLPTSWAAGTIGWNGWLAPGEYPRILNPESGRLWTANARVVGGDMLAVLGDGSYEVGSRARIIRERLMARQRFATRDLLDIQLDTSARFLERWRTLLLQTLTPAVTSGRPLRSELRNLVEQEWSGQAAAESAAYRLTRVFRDRVMEKVISFVLAECYETDLLFDYTNVRRREGPVWKLITEKPHHLLDPQYENWEQLLVAAADAAIELAQQDGGTPLGNRVWAEHNVTRYRHPLSGALPVVWRWLDMPAQALPGDLYTPNMHWRSNAPSERMVVAPGRESEGIMHMPTGQSGHPLSPFYSNSHDAWVRGTPTPFLPGPAVHRLTLVP